MRRQPLEPFIFFPASCRNQADDGVSLAVTYRYAFSPRDAAQICAEMRAKLANSNDGTFCHVVTIAARS